MKKLCFTGFGLALLLALCFASGCDQKPDDPTPVAPTATTPPPATSSPEPGTVENTEEPANPAAAAIIIYLNNQVYNVVPLPENKDEIIKVEQDDGVVNEITITPRGVFMSHSSCSNQDCVEQGTVTLQNHATRVLGGWIVCLPNQVSIEMVVREEEQ